MNAALAKLLADYPPELRTALERALVAEVGRLEAELAAVRAEVAAADRARLDAAIDRSAAQVAAGMGTSAAEVFGRLGIPDSE